MQTQAIPSKVNGTKNCFIVCVIVSFKILRNPSTEIRNRTFPIIRMSVPIHIFLYRNFKIYLR